MDIKLLFDITATQPIGTNKRHGGGKYGEIVLRRMLERSVPLVCYYDSSLWLNPETEELIKSSNVRLIDIKGRTIDEVVNESGCNTIFSALPKYDLLHYHGCRVIFTIHGLRTLETPADSYCFYYKNTGWRQWLQFFAKKFVPKFYRERLRNYKLKEWMSDNFQMVTVSNHSSYSIKTYFPEYKDKNIPVFYSPSTSSERNITRKYSEKYFLMVSGARPEKNNLRAIKALDYLFSNGYLDDLNVKITGVKSGDIYRYKIKNIERFDFLGFVDEEELDQLYHDAYSLIYPSLNEGFGYPPLEAMHYGVPVLASPFTSIPEVCEGAALYFNPFSVEEISARILTIFNEEVYEEYSKRAKLQYCKITAKQQMDLDALIDYIFNPQP